MFHVPPLLIVVTQLLTLILVVIISYGNDHGWRVEERHPHWTFRRTPCWSPRSTVYILWATVWVSLVILLSFLATFTSVLLSVNFLFNYSTVLLLLTRLLIAEIAPSYAFSLNFYTSTAVLCHFKLLTINRTVYIRAFLFRLMPVYDTV